MMIPIKMNLSHYEEILSEFVEAAHTAPGIVRIGSYEQASLIEVEPGVCEDDPEYLGQDLYICPDDSTGSSPAIRISRGAVEKNRAGEREEPESR